MRSCATCWSMIQSPSRPAAMMKLSWICPSGRRSESTESDVSGAGMASGGNSPCASSRRESFPEGAGPGETSIARRRKIQARRRPAVGRSANSGRGGGAGSPAVQWGRRFRRLPLSRIGSYERRSPAGPCMLSAGGASFAIIWLNSEYGSAAPGCVAGRTARLPRPGWKRGRRPAFHQPLSHGVAHEVVHERAVPEAHLGFRRVHVHVHFLGVAFQEQQRERIGRRRHQVVIRRGERVQQQAVADQPAVHENENGIAIALLHLRPREKARSGGTRAMAAPPARSGTRRSPGWTAARRRGNRQILLAHADLHQFIEHLAAEDLVDALLHAWPPA